MKDQVVFEVQVYSPIVCLNRLADLKLEIYNFRAVRDFTYTFSCRYEDEKKVRRAFKEAKIIKRTGPRGLLFNLLRKKTTVAALLVALGLFIFGSTRLFRIEIVGSSDSIDSMISEILSEKKIRRFAALPSVGAIKNLEVEIQKELASYIESIEIKKSGQILRLRYEKRRGSVVLPSLQHTLVASRDGVVTKFLIARGEKQVKVDQYVRAGQVLVAETIVGYDKEAVQTFTSGEVFAATWYVVEVETAHIDEATDHSELIRQADRLVLDGTKKLLGREILKYSLDGPRARMKIHYTLEENIAVSAEPETTE